MSIVVLEKQNNIKGEVSQKLFLLSYAAYLFLEKDKHYGRKHYKRIIPKLASKFFDKKIAECLGFAWECSNDANFLDIRNRLNTVFSSLKSDIDFLAYIAEQLFDYEVAKKLGAIFTPLWLADLITRKATKYYSQLNPGKPYPKLVSDFSCGPGVFLYCLRKIIGDKTSIIGVEKSPEYAFLAELAFYKEANIRINKADTLIDYAPTNQLNSFTSSKSISSDKYNIIVGNPPYVRSQLLDIKYADLLRKVYPSVTQGNFDLVILFLDHALQMLDEGGICSLLLSSKFLTSRYGKEICKRINSQSRVLEIIDFGDNQIFQGKITYTCVLTFAKISRNKSFSITRFPPGLDWKGTQDHLAMGEKEVLASDRLKTFPWNLESNMYSTILGKMRSSMPHKFNDVFSKIVQGVRTGNNSVFVLDKDEALELEDTVLKPLVTGQNIKRCQVVNQEKFILWPYERIQFGEIIPINQDKFEVEFPKAWKYLLTKKKILLDRNIDASLPWYVYSRTQNLDMPDQPKIIMKEMMASSEFFADIEGKYAISSGYAFVAPHGMSDLELKTWAAVLSTPTMEFLMRQSSTQLHSGWFRILKEHTKRIRLIDISKSGCLDFVESKKVLSVSDWEKLNILVAKASGLSKSMQDEIESYIKKLHRISRPAMNIDKNSKVSKSSGVNKGIAQTAELYNIPTDFVRKFIPVEFPQYYKTHCDRPDFRNYVTFNGNKNMPIHSWYKFTQGFSEGLVSSLLRDLGVSRGTVVYDPFLGSGTTMLTCRKLGYKSIGTEISPFLVWLARLKSQSWDVTLLCNLLEGYKKAKLKSSDTKKEMEFQDYFRKAYAPAIFEQIVAWKDWIIKENFDNSAKDFFLLALVSILEDISLIRKHGSHYRFLNNLDSVGLLKLNIKTISNDAEIKPLLIKKLQSMILDVQRCSLSKCPAWNIFNEDSRCYVPKVAGVDFVITSPPYLNRNNYMSQQKAEMAILDLVSNYEEFRRIVKNTFRSHVESRLEAIPVSKKVDIVNKIIESIDTNNLNNSKIPHMIAGYFDDIWDTFNTLNSVVKPGGKVAFIVGNTRWGGIVVPVDHLLVHIAEGIGFKLKRIYVTRLKGNSPQQMRKFGRIPLRESIVILEK